MKHLTWGHHKNINYYNICVLNSTHLWVRNARKLNTNFSHIFSHSLWYFLSMWRVDCLISNLHSLSHWVSSWKIEFFTSSPMMMIKKFTRSSTLTTFCLIITNIDAFSWKLISRNVFQSNINNFLHIDGKKLSLIHVSIF